jgi:hypothetical protein
MFCFHPMTHVTLHPVPPVGNLEILIHFISSGRMEYAEL